MVFYEVSFSPLSSDEAKSMLTVELMQVGFESFVEEENALLTYIPSSLFTESILKDLNFIKDHPEVRFAFKPLEDINWNKEWESNYQPVTIAGKCYVRAPFHPPMPGIDYEIVIEPKMAFGTAHHETTQLMAGWLMELGVVGKDVLDMGCGTGILAILANKMKAKSVTGIDNDEWAWRNSMENFRINGVAEGIVLQGDAAMIKPGLYDVILANINRNVLLQDMKSYFAGLREKGALLLSGFYQKDIEAIVACASGYSLRFVASRSLNDWSAVLFYK